MEILKCPTDMWLDLSERKAIEMKEGELICREHDGIWIGAIFEKGDFSHLDWELVQLGTREDLLNMTVKTEIISSSTSLEPSTGAGWEALGLGVRLYRPK